MKSTCLFIPAILLLGILTWFEPANAQAPFLDYLDVITLGDGEGGDDEFSEIASDSSGNLYVFGTFSGAVDFDFSPQRNIKTSGSTLTDELFLAKYDTSHTLIWLSTFNGTSSNGAEDITIDANGNIIICGNFIGTFNPDPKADSILLTSSSSNNADGFIAKYSPDGDHLLSFSLGGNSVDNVTAVTTDPSGNIFVTGAFSDTADLDPSTGTFNLIATGTFQDPFLAKYNSSGNLLWAFSLEGSGQPGFGWDVESASNGDIIVGGAYNGTVDFDPTPAVFNLVTNGNLDAFFARYSSNGAFQWAKGIGGFFEDQLYKIALGSNDEIYITGFFQSIADFDPSGNTAFLSAFNAKDIFLAKYDGSGNYMWAHAFGENSNDIGYSLDIDQDQDIYVTGRFSGVVDFDPSGFTNNQIGNGGDPFIASYSSSGAYRWAVTPTGTGFNEGLDIDVNAFRQVTIAGSFGNSIELDPGAGSSILTALNNSTSGFAAYYEDSTGTFIDGFSPVDREGGDDEAKDIITDAAGNYYVCGNMMGGFDFDPGINEMYVEPGGNSSAWLAKYNPVTGLSWVVTFPSSISSAAESMCFDKNGDILITGTFEGTTDFDPSPAAFNLLNASGNPNIYVAKFSPAGGLIWAKHMPGASTSSSFDINSDKLNNALVTGYFQGTVDFDPDIGSANLTAAIRDAFLLKLDANGNYVWALQIGGSSNDFGYGVSTDTNDNVYLAGEFRNVTDFDPSPGIFNLTPYGGDDGFIAKYNSGGDLVWANRYGGTGNDALFAIEGVETGNIYASGTFQNTADLDPAGGSILVVSEGSDDVCVLKVNSSGSTVWGESFGGSGFDFVTDLNTDSSRIFIAGSFADTVDFDPDFLMTFDLVSMGGTDGFINILDKSGVFLNAANWGGSSSDISNASTFINDKLHAAGKFAGNADFDPSSETKIVSSFGDDDAFVLKLGEFIPCMSTLDTISAAACDVYAGPSGKIFNTTGVFYDTISFENCDSVFRIELMISNSSIDTIEVHGCYSFTDPVSGSVLTSEGFFLTDTMFNTFGCDSLIVYDVMLDTSSSTETITACEFYDWGGNTYVVSGIYRDTFQNSALCDSIATLDLTILNALSSVLFVSECNSYTWPENGNTYTLSGTYTFTFPNGASNGCDSIVELNLTIDTTTTGKISESACEMYTWPATGITYTSSGTYRDTIFGGAFNGCDSVTILNLVIESSAVTVDSVSACDEYTWPANGTTYSNSGSYIDTLVSSNGCDSVINLILSLKGSVLVSDTVESCISYTWPLTGQTYTNSGTYTDTGQTIFSCDSIVTLALTIISIDTSVTADSSTLLANAGGGSYQWLDCNNNFSPLAGETNSLFSASQNGTYAVEISLNGCMDTSSCFNVNISGIENGPESPVVNVFPNPTSGELFITSEAGNLLKEIHVFNAGGKLILSKVELNTINEQIFLNKAAGVYILEVFTKHGIEHFRVIRK